MKPVTKLCSLFSILYSDGSTADVDVNNPYERGMLWAVGCGMWGNCMRMRYAGKGCRHLRHFILYSAAGEEVTKTPQVGANQ